MVFIVAHLGYSTLLNPSFDVKFMIQHRYAGKSLHVITCNKNSTRYYTQLRDLNSIIELLRDYYGVIIFEKKTLPKTNT